MKQSECKIIKKCSLCAIDVIYQPVFSVKYCILRANSPLFPPPLNMKRFTVKVKTNCAMHSALTD